MPRQCYRCEKNGTTREHFPPKAFFPGGGAGLQLRTVRSCEEHNNSKSGDDMYVLTQICMNAGKGDNLAKRRFMESVSSQLKLSPRFREMINHGAEWIDAEARLYPVDVARFDHFFDSLCCALYFEHFDKRFDPSRHNMHHHYLSFEGGGPMKAFAANMAKQFLDSFRDQIQHYDAAHADEMVYSNDIMAPAGPTGSITIVHSFYGVFEVVSMLSQRAPAGLFEAIQAHNGQAGQKPPEK